MDLLKAAALTDRFNALAELAAGVPHEINNPLTIALGRLQLARVVAQSSATGSDCLTAHFNAIEAALNRMAGVVKSMRQFCYSQDSGPKAIVSAGDVLHKALFFCADRIAKTGDISIITTGDPGIRVEVNVTQMCSALVELIKNAIDAVADQSEKRVSIDISTTSGRVLFRVTDNGHGISSDVACRVMEPFFTTREVGHGTGLGLSSARGIVQAHRGKLTFESGPGLTVFEVDLPCPDTA